MAPSDNPKLALGTAAAQHLERITAFRRDTFELCRGRRENASQPASPFIYPLGRRLIGTQNPFGSERVMTSLLPPQVQETHLGLCSFHGAGDHVERRRRPPVNQGRVISALASAAASRKLKQNLLFGLCSKLRRSSRCQDGKVKRVS